MLLFQFRSLFCVFRGVKNLLYTHIYDFLHKISIIICIIIQPLKKQSYLHSQMSIFEIQTSLRLLGPLVHYHGTLNMFGNNVGIL